MIGNFIDRDSDYQPNSLRRTVPGVVTPDRPVEVPLDGIVSGEHAAKEINRMVAAQAFHAASLSWEMLLDESRAYPRGDVTGLTHGLAGEGVGGRLREISADRITLTPLNPVSTAGYVWIWDLNGDVVSREYTLTDGDLVLNSALPDPPGGIDDEPMAYQYTAFEQQSDLVKVRIVGKTPVGPNRVRFTARYEDDDYYDHRISDLTWDPIAGTSNPTLVSVGGFTVTENDVGARVFTWSLNPVRNVVGYRIRYLVSTGSSPPEWESMQDLHDRLVAVFAGRVCRSTGARRLLVCDRRRVGERTTDGRDLYAGAHRCGRAANRERDLAVRRQRSGERAWVRRQPLSQHDDVDGLAEKRRIMGDADGPERRGWRGVAHRSGPSG